MAETVVERWLSEDGASSILVIYVAETGLYEARGGAGERLFAHLELTQVRLWLLGARDDDEIPPRGRGGIDL